MEYAFNAHSCFSASTERFEQHSAFSLPGIRGGGGLNVTPQIRRKPVVALTHLAPHKDEIQHKHDRKDISQSANFAVVSAGCFDDRIADKTECQAIGNRTRQRNADDDQERRNGFSAIPVATPNIFPESAAG